MNIWSVFCNRRHISKELVTITSVEVAEGDQFRYLGSIIHNNGEIEEEVTNITKTSWWKWRNPSEVYVIDEYY